MAQPKETEQKAGASVAARASSPSHGDSCQASLPAADLLGLADGDTFLAAAILRAPYF
jgi:hypothetical protein